MLSLLDMDKSLIKQYRSKGMYKAHNYLIRKLRRIYQNKEKGETELSTKQNEEEHNQIKRE